jgi:hypothetical protein
LGGEDPQDLTHLIAVAASSAGSSLLLFFLNLEGSHLLTLEGEKG